MRSTETAATALQLVDHSLVATKLSRLRDEALPPDEFRRYLGDVSLILACEAARHWPTASVDVQTPLASTRGALLSRPVVAVPILRAGLGMLDGVLRLIPESFVGHIGLYRDEETLRPVSYFTRLPVNLAQATVLLLDPMLATGHSACEAAAILKTQGAKSIQFLCVVASPEGLTQMQTAHPDVQIFAAAVDDGLNSRGYIVPGLGDAGDRCFGTG